MIVTAVVAIGVLRREKPIRNANGPSLLRMTVLLEPETRNQRPENCNSYSTVTDFARFLG